MRKIEKREKSEIPRFCLTCNYSHVSTVPHNYNVKSYQERFEKQYRRRLTHEDAAAHLTTEQKWLWRATFETVDPVFQWTVPPAGKRPIAEPFVPSTGKVV